MGMFEEGFLVRLRRSVDRVLLGLDLIIAFAIAGVPYVLFREETSAIIIERFLQTSVSLSTTLIIVTVTSVSILVSLSNSSVIVKLKEDRLYTKFLFTFEFTAVLAILTSVVGTVLYSVSVGADIFYLYVFFFTYTVLAALTILSRLITYGDKIAQHSLAESLPDMSDQVTEKFEDEEVESPNE